MYFLNKTECSPRYMHSSYCPIEMHYHCLCGHSISRGWNIKLSFGRLLCSPENCISLLGRTLAEYFQDMDVVPSDFAAGLVLLRKHQKHQENVALMRAIEEQEVLDSQVCG